MNVAFTKTVYLVGVWLIRKQNLKIGEGEKVFFNILRKLPRMPCYYKCDVKFFKIKKKLTAQINKLLKKGIITIQTNSKVGCIQKLINFISRTG